MPINIRFSLHLTATNSGVVHDFNLNISKREHKILTTMKPGEFYTRNDLFNLGIDLNMGMTKVLDQSSYLCIDTKHLRTYYLNVIGVNLHRMLVNI